MCVCVRRISLDGEGNALYPELSSSELVDAVRVHRYALETWRVFVSGSTTEMLLIGSILSGLSCPIAAGGREDRAQLRSH